MPDPFDFRSALPVVVLCGACFAGAPAAAAPPTVEQLDLIDAALPRSAYAQPRQPRRLLVFTLTRGYRHSSIETGVEALTRLGRRSGAFEAVHSEDVSAFEPDSLARFDAVCFLNTTGEPFTPADVDTLPPEQRQAALAREERLKGSLSRFVSTGGGFVGIHAATDTFYQWPEYGEMIGGYFDGHPWHERVVIANVEPDHPINAAFEGCPLEIADEIYQFRDPYAKDRARILLRLDASRTDMSKSGVHRTDGDFAVSWVKRHRQGRVFYCSLGHREEVYWNPAVLGHYLAGIQFALGDLEAYAFPVPERRTARGDDAAPPRAPASTQAAGEAREPAPREAPARADDVPWRLLFNGRNLDGWQGLVENPRARAAMPAPELARRQAEADQRAKAHWRVEDGVLVYDGHPGENNLCTGRDYQNFELKLEWKIVRGGDSGVYLRGSPQVQIWDADEHPEGSGGLYNNEREPNSPRVKADRPVGEWNEFYIRMIGERVTVRLNDEFVVDDVLLENYWERDKPIYAAGPIELQSHGSPLWFRNIRIRELDAAGRPVSPVAHGRLREHDAAEAAPEGAAAAPGRAEEPRPRSGGSWRALFNGRDLDGWTCKPGSWTVEDGALALRGGDFLWTNEQFGDFVLALEFKVASKGNSGIFLRTSDTREWLHTGIEVQVLDSYGKPEMTRHDCGAIYDCLAPSRNACKPAGEWNEVEIHCRGSRIEVILNKQPVIDMNLDEWIEAGRNPDGTPNKFRTAYRDMPRRGYIGFQDHGNPVWFRNVRIRVDEP